MFVFFFFSVLLIYIQWSAEVSSVSYVTGGESSRRQDLPVYFDCTYTGYNSYNQVNPEKITDTNVNKTNKELFKNQIR